MEKIIDIKVTSKKYAVDFSCSKPWAAISVATMIEDFVQIKEENRVGLLQMAFWDVSNPHVYNDERLEVRCFTPELAHKILDFVEEVLPKIDVLLVHCEAGLSRSPAIAAAISNIYWGPEMDKVYFKHFTPNTFVYQTLLTEYFGKGSPEALAARERAAEEVYGGQGWDCKE